MSRLQLSVRAVDLKNRAKFFRGISDPYAELTVSGGEHVGVTIGRTETLRDWLSPTWTEKFIIDFHRAGSLTPITVSIYDDRNLKSRENGDGEEKDDVLIDCATFEVAEILDSVGREVGCDLDSGGTAYLHINDSVRSVGWGVDDHLCSAGSLLRFQFRGLDIKNIEAGGFLGLGVVDPFFEIRRKFSDAASGVMRWDIVYRSKHVPDSVNPIWDEAVVDLEQFCHLDLDLPLQIVVFDWEKKGRHRRLGESMETTVRGIVSQVSVRGNADKESAFEIFQQSAEEESRSGENYVWGLVSVLSAQIMCG